VLTVARRGAYLRFVGTRKWHWVALSSLGIASHASLLAALEDEDDPDSSDIPTDAPRPRFELALRSGLSVPVVYDPVDVGAGPSAGALVLFRPASGVAFGVSGDVARLPWYDDEYLVPITYGADLRLYTDMPRSSELYVNLLFALVDMQASTDGGTCDARGGFVFGTTLGAERYFTRAVRLGAELGYHFGGTFTGACPAIYDPTAGPSYPNMTPGFALRVVGTYGAR
jgi:hypothetical protein